MKRLPHTAVLPTAESSNSPLNRLQQRTLTVEEIVSLLITYQLFPKLVSELIIDDEIASFTCSVEETLSVCQHFYEQHQIHSEAERQAWLARHQLSLKQLDHLMTRNLRIEKFKQAMWGHQLESHFLQRKGRLDRAIYSLIRTQDLHLAQELYFRIQAGEQSFAELAQQYSQGPEANTGGLIGPSELQTLHPGLAAKLAAGQPGQLLAPTQLGDWVIIVRLEKFIPAQFDEAMHHRLLDELFEHWLNEKMDALEV